MIGISHQQRCELVTGAVQIAGSQPGQGGLPLSLFTMLVESPSLFNQALLAQQRHVVAAARVPIHASPIDAGTAAADNRQQRDRDKANSDSESSAVTKHYLPLSL